MDQRAYLRLHREPCPTWLAGFQPGNTLNPHHFFKSRVVYYPGSGSDGHAVKLFGSTHSAHCFVYVDYQTTECQIKEQLDGHSDGYHGPFKGYHCLERLSLTEADWFPMGWARHAQGLNSVGYSADFKPFAFLEVLERDDNYGDDHGATRLAILFIGADGITTFDTLFCQGKDVLPPYAMLIQDHGFGGNYDRFGQGGLLEGIADQCKVHPDFLLMAENAAAWTTYSKISDVEGSVGGMHGTVRHLYKRNQT